MVLDPTIVVKGCDLRMAARQQLALELW